MSYCDTWSALIAVPGPCKGLIHTWCCDSYRINWCCNGYRITWCCNSHSLTWCSGSHGGSCLGSIPLSDVVWIQTWHSHCDAVDLSHCSTCCTLLTKRRSHKNVLHTWCCDSHTITRCCNSHGRTYCSDSHNVTCMGSVPFSQFA